MSKDYSRNLIKSYNYWDLYVHENQNYLGRCIVWCKRENALELTDATVEEQIELFEILKDLRQTANKIFKPDWYNYSFLGNETKHLHGHFIPRYSKAKIFMKIKFEDKLFGKNYKTDHEFVTSKKVLMKIKNLYKLELK